MHTKGQFSEVEGVMDEYFASKHAERVPRKDLEKPPSQVFYLPIHVGIQVQQQNCVPSLMRLLTQLHSMISY